MAGRFTVSPWEILRNLQSNARTAPWLFWPPLLLTLGLIFCAAIYLFFYLASPIPRPALPIEKTYITSTPSGKPSPPQPLPNWYDSRSLRLKIASKTADPIQRAEAIEKAKAFIEEPDIAMSVVVPAYNEEKRLVGMLEEAVTYLDKIYGRPKLNTMEMEASENTSIKSNNSHTNPQDFNSNGTRRRTPSSSTTKTGKSLTGYEILLVNDGSTDSTVEVALEFAQKHELHDILRIVTLRRNRGKGGAVCHGLKHVGGEYAVFADADGASRFGDLGKLVEGCRGVEDGVGRGVAVGSRAWLVGSEAVVKRSALRNTLMHSFHLLLRLLTPPATSRIRDTQCGFKLFSRKALPFIIPYMHAEGWIFDVEMLMLAESSPDCENSERKSIPEKGEKELREVDGKDGGNGGGIRVAEVPIAWNEVGGSKLNVMWDSLGMAWGLAVLRGAWILGVYSR